MPALDHNPHHLPADLPAPPDDGACRHLPGSLLPAIALPSTSGSLVHLNAFARPTILFFYPRTGVPGQAPGLGFHGETWESIPGARGCTPQSCAFRDAFSRFSSLDVDVLGVSTNTTPHQREFKARNHVPFDFLSDAALGLTRALRLPTFEFPVESGGPNTLLKRMAWLILPGSNGARIAHLWYPVFPPDKNAADVLDWLLANPRLWRNP